MSFHDVIREATALAKPYRSLEVIDLSRLLLQAGGADGDIETTREVALFALRR